MNANGSWLSPFSRQTDDVRQESLPRGPSCHSIALSPHVGGEERGIEWCSARGVGLDRWSGFSGFSSLTSPPNPHLRIVFAHPASVKDFFLRPFSFCSRGRPAGDSRRHFSNGSMTFQSFFMSTTRPYFGADSSTWSRRPIGNCRFVGSSFSRPGS